MTSTFTKWFLVSHLCWSHNIPAWSDGRGGVRLHAVSNSEHQRTFCKHHHMLRLLQNSLLVYERNAFTRYHEYLRREQLLKEILSLSLTFTYQWTGLFGLNLLHSLILLLLAKYNRYIIVPLCFIEYCCYC